MGPNQKRRCKRHAEPVPAVRTVLDKTYTVVAEANSRRCQDTMTVLDWVPPNGFEDLAVPDYRVVDMSRSTVRDGRDRSQDSLGIDLCTAGFERETHQLECLLQIVVDHGATSVKLSKIDSLATLQPYQTC